MSNSTEFIELRSEEVQELLTRVPAWTLRWGITVIIIILALIFWGSWLVHYPDLIRASFKLTSIDAPKVLLARTDGKLIKLFAKEGENVSAGKVLAYLESTAQHLEVLRLETQLEKAWKLASKDNLEMLKGVNLVDYHQLGELQNAYQTFRQVHIQLQAYLKNGYFDKKEALLVLEIADKKIMAKHLKAQQLIQAQDMKLSQEEYDIQKLLAEQHVIAPMELKREESKYINRKLSYQQTASLLISNIASQRSTEKEILELKKNVTEQRDIFLQALNTLQSAVATWKTKYVVIAPVQGRTYFAASLQENQNLTVNQELMYIAPPTSSYFGELRIPQQNFGKVKLGQDVIIKFIGYPYQEFGSVKGRIVSIAEVPMKDSVFLAKVDLISGLKTSYGKKIVYKTGMSASADIITADNRLMEKLLFQLRKLPYGGSI